MLKRTGLMTAGLISALGLAGGADAALSTGDIAFTGINADGNDGFAFVALVDIPETETIYFRDDEWDGSAFGSGEGEFAWNAPVGGISAGTVVTFVTDAGGLSTTSLGTTSDSDGAGGYGGDLGISSGGETVFAFQGTSNTPATFLAAITTADDIEDTLAGTGLSLGTTAIVLGDDIDGNQYTGPRDSETAFGDYLSLIGDVANNWQDSIDGSGDQSGDLLPFNTTPFVIPEPASLGLLAAGGLLMVGRRRG